MAWLEERGGALGVPSVGQAGQGSRVADRSSRGL